jgi:hypothetical protein
VNENVMDGQGMQIDGQRVLAIMQQQFPKEFQIAVQQVTIEQQNEVIAALRERMSPDQVSPSQ